jgi:lipopolysaccharide transport system ATP-binding protein
MSDIVISVQDISKQYRLGNVSTGTLSHDINRLWHKLRRKEDPYLKIGDSNDRTIKGGSEYVWALKNINFEVKHGEVLGIIGRNGAGKSTLLKILSRTTAPTTGKIKIKGRVASLLEVGTGFHPELSGRDNIFLNGAILGMTKNEIKRKFDEIVDFAGVERYIDTPVKRYSSGMYVRLAFAVAAHLEPEILIIDEVLAVGDAEFQKKALGKMKDVSGKEGRTVLFVSHNMAAVKNLCSRGIFLSDGLLAASGTIHHVTEKYLEKSIFEKTIFEKDYSSNNTNDNIILKSVEIIATNSDEIININTPFVIKIEFDNLNFKDSLNCNIKIENISGVHIFSVVTDSIKLNIGRHVAKCFVPGGLLNDDTYLVSFMYVANSANVLLNLKQIFQFSVEDYRSPNQNWYGKWPGLIRPKLNFIIE